MTRTRSTWMVLTWSVLIVTLIVVASASVVRAQEVFASISSAHFEIKYQRGVSEADVRKVATFLQDDYRYLSERLGMELPKKLEVRIYDSPGKFKYEAANRQDWRQVNYLRGVLHVGPLQGVVNKKSFQTALSFEFALAFLAPLGDKGCPRWLREALAVYHSGEGDVLTAPMGGRMVSFADLNQDIQEYPNPPQRDDVHFVLNLTMKFFIEKYGEKKVFAMFKEWVNTVSVERVFKKVLAEEFDAVEKAWATYVAAHSAPMKY
jgi:hypothetical protein